MKQAKTSSSPTDLAFKFLSFRPRSEAEVATYLKRKRIPLSEIGTTIQKLKDLQFLNDVQFCEWWQESRDRSHPVSARILTAEIRNKGVASGIIADIVVTDSGRECARATQALQQKRHLSNITDPQVKQKAIQFLSRRGFSWEIISRVIGSSSDWPLLLCEVQYSVKIITITQSVQLQRRDKRRHESYQSFSSTPISSQINIT